MQVVWNGQASIGVTRDCGARGKRLKWRPRLHGDNSEKGRREEVKMAPILFETDALN